MICPMHAQEAPKSIFEYFNFSLINGSISLNGQKTAKWPKLTFYYINSLICHRDPDGP